MTNWNTELRPLVEAAAATGNTEAQAALSLHLTLDRIDRGMAQLRREMRETVKELDRQIEALRKELSADTSKPPSPSAEPPQGERT